MFIIFVFPQMVCFEKDISTFSTLKPFFDLEKGHLNIVNSNNYANAEFNSVFTWGQNVLLYK